ncbi:hypothetical protein LCGC14_1612300 [marine sediment metagenome]|uniref:Uncharacterized protein n=1 Tax=marine sediment metagenome TaxID=412755 RepID=A0A0F9KNM7_9ZZZZ
MDKKRLLELAGIVQEQQKADFSQISIVNYLGEQIIDSMVEHYFELKQTGEIESESDFIEIMEDSFRDQYDFIVNEFYSRTKFKVLDELPQRLKQVRRELLAQKRQRKG